MYILKYKYYFFFESKLSSTFLKGQKQKGPVQRSFFNTSNITSQLHNFSFHSKMTQSYCLSKLKYNHFFDYVLIIVFSFKLYNKGKT